MAIKAQCGSCANTITVRDEFGGKVVKCPKCKNPMKLPLPGTGASGASPTAAQRAAATTSGRQAVANGPRSGGQPAVGGQLAGGGNPSGKQKVAAVGAGAPKRYNPLLDLLDEAGVESKPTGPVCDSCQAPMSPTAIICIECGYNMATGQKLETSILVDNDTASMTDAEKLLAKAEKDIDEAPVTAEGQDFGDKLSDSYLIAMVALVAAGIFVGVGLTFVLSMDWILSVTGAKPSQISLFMSILMWIGCGIWITAVAFRADPRHALGCVFTGGLYCPLFGFMSGRGLLIPSVVMLASVVIGLASYLATIYLVDAEEAFRWIDKTRNWLEIAWLSR